MSLYEKYPKATPQHRLAGLALEIALMLTTCFLGWLIWSLVVWGKGLTPAKQILKMQVVGVKTGLPATWGHMAIRQFLIPLAFTLPFTVLQYIVNPAFSDYRYSLLGGYGEAGPSIPFAVVGSSIGALIVYLISWGFSLADALWIFQKRENRRITDLVAGTDVMNVSVNTNPVSIVEGQSS